MFIALRDLMFAKGRFILMGLVISLVAFMITLLSGLAAGLIKNNISGLMALDVTHLAFEYNDKPNYRNSMVERYMWEIWEQQPGVKAVQPLGHTMFNGRTLDDEPLDDLVLWGIVPGSFLEAKAVTGEQLGRLENGVIISSLLADKKGVKIGDIIVLDRVLTELEVVGITEEHNIGHVPILYTPLRKWQEATYGPPGGPAPGEKLPDILFDFASVIALQLEPGVDIENTDIEAGTVTMGKEPSYEASSGYKEEIATVRMIQWFLIIISAVVIGAFFTIWTIQRTQEIGLIKALGASTWFVMKDLLGQALILMILATTLGALAGLWLGGIFEKTGNPFMLQLDTVFSSSLLLIVAGVLGSLISVRLISKVDPIIALGRER